MGRVRRQIFCDIWACDRREDLAHLGLMLSGLAAMLQASGFDCVALYYFSFQQDSLAASEVNIGWRQVADVLVVNAICV